MLELILREEFRGRHLRTSAIALHLPAPQLDLQRVQAQP